MIFIIKAIAKTFAALNSNSKPTAVAAAVSTALLLALIPAGNLLWITLFLLTLIFRLNWGIELLFWAIFKGLALLLYPITEPLGWNLLQKPGITELVYRLNEIPFMVYFDFQNSLVIGGLVVGLISWIPLFFIARLAIVLFREKLSPAIAKSKWMKSIQKAPLVSTLTKAVRQFAGMYR